MFSKLFTNISLQFSLTPCEPFRVPQFENCGIPKFLTRKRMCLFKKPWAVADATHLPDEIYAYNRVCDNRENPDDSDFNNGGETPLVQVTFPVMLDYNVSGSVRRSTHQRKPVDKYGAVPYI